MLKELHNLLILTIDRNMSQTNILEKNTLWRNSYYVRNDILIPCFTLAPPIEYKTLEQPYVSEVIQGILFN